ncbi:ATP-dependent Clp protease adaptor ClpS [Candidatus Vallotia lariciata]|uniref:ATP-dependent Clp protease adaptor ClpS n=1 Tax=Candidatus Vallotia laricis TaxID=2018052 RepID=UPI001D02E1AE
MLNNNSTPTKFVVIIIQRYFNKDRNTVIRIMLKVYLKKCGVYTQKSYYHD